MAGQADDRPPFWAVVRLTAWATANKYYLQAKVAGRQIDPSKLNIRALLGLMYELMIEEFSSVWTTPHAVREQIDEFLNTPGLVPRSVLEQAKRVEAAQLRASWGRTPDAIAGQRAAMALTGALPRRDGGGR